MPGAGPDFTCHKCYERGLECKQSSPHYHKMFTCQLRTVSNPLPPPVPRAHHTSRAASNAVAGPSHRSCSPPMGEHWHTSWDTSYNIPGPAYEILVGREGYYTWLDSVHAVLFWRSELECFEAMIDSSYRQRNFHWKMLNEPLARCMVPPPDDGAPCTKRIKFTSPTSPRGRACFSMRRNKGKHRADLVPEEPSQDKGKGRTDPVASSGKEEGSAASGESEEWFSL
jgi:hypothetical protein